MQESKKNIKVNVAIKSEEQYLAILNSLKEPMHIIDKDYRFQFLNLAMIQWLNKLKISADIIGENLFKEFPFLEYDKIYNEYNGVFKTGEILITLEATQLNTRRIFTETQKIPVKSNGKVEQVITIMRDITEQKEAEEKLKASEEKYKNIINNLMDIIIILDLKGKFLYASPQIYDISGFTQKEIIGKNGFKLMHPDDTNEALKVLKEAIEQKKKMYVEYRTVHKQGHYIDVSASGRIVNLEGEDRVFAVVRDISEQKISKQILKESEEKYRQISENAYDLITIFDDNFTYEYINEKPYLNLLGYTANDLIGRTGIDFLHPDEKEYIVDQFKKVITEGSASVFVRLKHKLGHYIWTDTIGTLFVDKDGNRKVIAITRDVSERIAAEEELKKSEEKHRLILENANDLISIFNTDFKHEYINEQAYFKLLGYTKDDLIGHTPLKFLHSDDAEKVANIFSEGFKKGSGKSIFRLKSKSGHFKWIESRGTTFIDTNGEKKGLIISRDITESREANQRLRESEEMFRTIAEQSFMGLIILQDGVFKYFNEQAAIINGYSTEEMQDWKPYEFQKLIYPADRDFVIEQARKKQVGDHDVITNYKYRVVKKNGEVIWVENYSKSINYKGKIADFVMTIDINDKIEAEDKLRDSEEKYRLISENTDDLIVVYSENGIVEYINEETHSRILGYSIENLTNKSFRDTLVHEDDKEIAKIKAEEGLKNGSHYYQFRLKHQKGSYLWFEVFGKTFTDSSKNKKILCVSRNIDEKKSSENKIKESEENFRTIAEQAFIGTLIIQDDKVEYVNNALLQIFEFSNEEIESWSKNDLLNLIYPEDLEYLREYRERIRAGESDINPFYTYRVFTKYGRMKWIDQFSKPIIYRGKPAELVTIMDITEKKKAEKELIKLNNLKSELLRRTSHELKTPLVSIKGFSELLLTVHRDKLDDYVLATIHEIKLGCERLENLIQDILKTSELESESAELKKQEEDLSFLIKLCIKELQGLIRLRNHEINVEIHDKLITWFEPEQIHLVVSNLLSNAIKYTPPEGKIIIKSAKTQDEILISIQDNGIGITNEEKKRLFSQFGKIERYGQGLDIISDGSGLGLFITKKIIDLHGGTIKVKSGGRNKGSTFYFTLPLITKN